MCAVAGGFLKFQLALLQALVADVLPDSAFAADEAADAYLRASAFEPGISICSRIHAMGLRPATFNIKPSALPFQVRNVMRQLGTISTSAGPVDPIGELPSPAWVYVRDRRFGLSLHGLVAPLRAKAPRAHPPFPATADERLRLPRGGPPNARPSKRRWRRRRSR